MPIVILEGPDGGGKTTLANSLLKRTGYPTILIKRSGPPGNRETVRRMATWLISQPDYLNIICDRHPIISECIYASAIRGEDILLSNDHLSNILQQSGCLTIYCRPPEEILRISSQREEQMEGVHENLTRLTEAYDSLMRDLRKRGRPIYLYDFSEQKALEEALETVKSFFKEGAERGLPG